MDVAVAMQQNTIDWLQTLTKGLIKETLLNLSGNCTDISNHFEENYSIWDNWLHESALGFAKETKMQHFMQDYCWWLCLCLLIVQGQIKMSILVGY